MTLKLLNKRSLNITNIDRVYWVKGVYRVYGVYWVRGLRERDFSATLIIARVRVHLYPYLAPTCPMPHAHTHIYPYTHTHIPICPYPYSITPDTSDTHWTQIWHTSGTCVACIRHTCGVAIRHGDGDISDIGIRHRDGDTSDICIRHRDGGLLRQCS